jgi:hypothetical protein
MDSLFGAPLYVIPCTAKFVRWRRTHRNNRIAKKWRKKYGMVTRCECPAYRIGHRYYMCRCVAEAIKKETR